MVFSDPPYFLLAPQFFSHMVAQSPPLLTCIGVPKTNHYIFTYKLLFSEAFKKFVSMVGQSKWVIAPPRELGRHLI
jgi:hypothetical protein